MDILEKIKGNYERDYYVNKLSRNNYSTGVKGVHYDKRTNMYYAHIGYKYKKYCLGYFDTLEKAIKVRKDAEQKIKNLITQEKNGG